MRSFKDFLKIKQLHEDIILKTEDDGGAVAGGEVAPPSTPSSSDVISPEGSITPDGALHNTDVLGNCDHKNDGVLGPGCYHVPVPAFPPQSRLLKKKKKKYDNVSEDIVEESKKSDEYEIKTAETLNAMFRNSKMKYRAEWNQHPKNMVLEASNMESDISILNKSGNKITTIEAKSQWVAQLFNVSLNKLLMFSDNNIDEENRKFKKIVWNKSTLPKTISNEILKQLNDRSNEFNKWFFTKFYKHIKGTQSDKRRENIKDMCMTWLRTHKMYDIVKIDIGKIGKAIRDHYRKKNTSYIILADNIFSIDDDILGLGVPQLIDDVFGMLSLRFKPDSLAKHEFSRIISRITLKAKSYKQLKKIGFKISSDATFQK